ncbi:MAG: bacterio-opsin activator domain-containing protein, partial [Halalkalicoccus sp.]
TRTLQGISTELIQEDDIGSLSDRVIDAAIEILDADFASFQLYDRERNDLELVTHRGFNGVAESSWSRVTPADGSTCARALETSERVIVRDVERCTFMAGSDDREIYLQTGIRAVQTTPLVSRGGDLLGMFSTHWETVHDPSERDLSRLDILARQAADLIEHQQTVEAVRESEAELDRLNTASRELLEIDADEIRDRGAELVQSVLDVEYAALWRYDEIDGELREYASVTDVKRDETPVYRSEEFADRVWQAFIDDDIVIGTEPTDDHVAADERLWSFVLLPLGRHGVVLAGSLQRERFDGRTIDLVETLRVTLETAWNRAEGERELARQNEELERLDRLNSLIRAIDQAIVSAETREGIDRTVCERLADSELFEFAWLGEYDGATDRMVPTAWAGVDGEYLETRTVSVDDAPSEDPLVAAFRTHEMQTVPDIATDTRTAPWRVDALERGARSSVAVPLVYDGSLYGVLTVYGGHPRPDERETDVLAELGETIAHAISAIEARTTRRSDSVVELALRSSDADTPLSRLARETNCEIAVQGLVPGANDVPTVFFTARGVSPSDITAAGERILAIEELTCLAGQGEDALFRARIADSSLVSMLVTREVAVRSMSIDRGTITLVVDLSESEDVREFVEALWERLPDGELLSRTTRSRPFRTRQTIRMALRERLTPRQLEVLQTAYRSGFFESPRVQTGRELAGGLGISQSTFSLHLRESQRKLCELVLEAA